MAVNNGNKVLPYIAGEDLSSSQFLLVVGDSTADQVVLAGDGENAVGVVDEPNTSGRPVSIASDGVVKAYAGGVVAVGARVASDAAGKVVTAASGDYVLGVAKTAGAANVLIEFTWDKNGVEPA